MKKEIAYVFLVIIFILSCENKAHIQENQVHSIDSAIEKYRIRQSIYSLFNADPLSNIYYANSWGNAMPVMMGTLNIDRLNLKVELYEPSISSKNMDLPYKVLLVKNDSCYFFPINDWYYYNLMANIEVNKCDSSCQREMINFLQNSISLERHFNHIFEIFSPFTEMSLDINARSSNALLFVRSVLINFYHYTETLDEKEIQTKLKDKSFKMKSGSYYYKYGDSVFELNIYFEKKVMAKFKLLNLTSFKDMFTG